MGQKCRQNKDKQRQGGGLSFPLSFFNAFSLCALGVEFSQKAKLYNRHRWEGATGKRSDLNGAGREISDPPGI